jgi:Ca2+/Na+ antiporter
MSDDSRKQARNGDEGVDAGMLVIAALSVMLLVVFRRQGWRLAFLLAETGVISIVLWQACDPFAEAAQWIGKVFHLPGSVRGATLDAVASSMPEFFSGIFFVLVAILAVGGDRSALSEAAGEGYGATIATCAGSAIYNMIVIPAACALVIAFTRRSRPRIDVERPVLSRDGLFYVACVGLLLGFLCYNQMAWWMALVLLALYGFYILVLFHDARAYRRVFPATRGLLDETGLDADPKHVAAALAERGIRVKPKMVVRIQDALRHGKRDPDPNGEKVADRARLLFGFVSLPLNGLTVWLVILGSTTIAAAACYFLVTAVLETATLLDVPAFFVAVILAAAASSVPDTLLSIGASRRGDDSGAVSNAFGSNIFDICVCLSVPLLISCYLNDWRPITLLQDGKPMVGLLGLQGLLLVLTLITLLIIWHKRQVTLFKAVILCGLYAVFIAYAVLGSLGIPFLGYSL